MRSGEWTAWFSFWFSGCWRALAKGTAWAVFYCVILLLLLEGSTIKAKEADNFTLLLTDVAIPGGMSRVDAVGYLADAGIYTTEAGMV